MEINLGELVFVNGNLGTYDKKNKIFEGTPGRCFTDYLKARNLGTLVIREYPGNANIELEGLTPDQEIEFNSLISRFNLAEKRAHALLVNKVFDGDF